jgi:hypothetical protein
VCCCRLVVENGHDLVNCDNGIIVGTGTEPTFTEQINRSLVEVNLNAEPTGTTTERGMLTLSDTYARCLYTICFVLIY